MIIIKITLVIILNIIKYLFLIFWFMVVSLILFPVAILFMLLSILNYEYFWDKLWCGLLDYLDGKNLFPKFIVK